jgi:hypothetical protein
VRLLSEELKSKCKMRHQDFIRNCLLTFPVIVAFILNLIRKSIQVELNCFTSMLSLKWISKQAFSAARQKLSPTVFIDLNQTLISEFYTDNEFKTLFGCRLIGVDGSTLQLPNNMEMEKKYGVCTNQTKTIFPMARTSFAYDLLNGITLDALLSPYSSSEKDLAVSHLQNIVPLTIKDLYIFDRGYPAVWLIFFHIIHGKEFLMRCSTQFIDEVNKFVKEGRKDGLIELSIRGIKKRQRSALRKLIPNLDLDFKIRLRVVVITLNTGENEILITTLCDSEKIKYEVFADFYHFRWGIEENYKLQKCLLQIENFSGESSIAVEQDFYATIFTANVRALLVAEAQHELKEQSGRKETMYDYKVNRNVSIGILKEKLVESLLNPTINLETFCSRLKEQMKKSMIPIRNGRTFERIRRNNRKRKFCRNQRRSL